LKIARLVSIGLALVAGITVIPLAAGAAAPPKIKVCHFPPDAPTNYKILDLPQNAFAAHQAHGDYRVAPNDATCDGKDDDCDHQIDEDYVGRPRAAGSARARGPASSRV